MRSNLSRTLLGGLAALVLGGSVAVAFGAPSQASEGTGDIAVHSAATTRAAQDRVTDYWTPQRMREALPADVLVAGKDKSSAGGTVAAGSPTVVPLAAAKPAPTAAFVGGYYSGGGEVVDTTGKVFFTLAGVNYVCSGSAVSSGNKDVVLTAGHCVNEGPGEFATNWAFVPAYDDGARPYGTFTARQLTTTTQWQTSGDFDYDVAFAVLNTLNGAHLTDVVGGQAIGFNQARGQYMYSFGYPAANPYDGSDIAWCHGTVVQDTFGGSSDQGLDCNLTGGSSGGPWFVNYSESTGVGVLNSVNSFKYRGGSMRNYMFGPYLGDVAQTLYTSASSL
ncbi:trypsin-like serine peptidase [Promicromonospora kroppenstedtii]|uniref:trypsin-like serine peptidase n=1 Tax=Promicromonospora kroppenstedtii TaxID=440482 RepID=UPI0004B72C3B|nr:trypsin-like peptidase domain-containing protein [Promicromonospora kroppenstedtii]